MSQHQVLTSRRARAAFGLATLFPGVDFPWPFAHYLETITDKIVVRVLRDYSNSNLQAVPTLKTGSSEQCLLDERRLRMADQWVPISHANCDQMRGPFYHGTKAELLVGDLITTGHLSHFEGRALKHVYFSGLLEPAIWGAELAMALSKLDGRGYIYVVQPTGPFEDDPNLTNRRFPGNPTQSFRTCDPLRIVEIVDDWKGHPAEVLQGMLESLADLKRRGLAVVED